MKKSILSILAALVLAGCAGTPIKEPATLTCTCISGGECLDTSGNPVKEDEHKNCWHIITTDCTWSKD